MYEKYVNIYTADFCTVLHVIISAIQMLKMDNEVKTKWHLTQCRKIRQGNTKNDSTGCAISFNNRLFCGLWVLVKNACLFYSCFLILGRVSFCPGTCWVRSGITCLFETSSDSPSSTHLVGGQLRNALSKCTSWEMRRCYVWWCRESEE